MTSVRDWLESNLDVARTHRYPDGDELVLRECLFCGKSEKMYVNLGKLKFNCYSSHCGASGNLMALIMAIEGCSYSAAVEIIGRLASGIAKARPTSELAAMFKAMIEGARDPQVDLSVPLPPGYRPCYDPETGTYSLPAYLTKTRNIEPKVARRWRMGYCATGRYAGRVIIPVSCQGMTSFVARATFPGAQQKYLNPGTLQAHFLMGYDRLDPGEPVCAMEGAFDAIRWSEWGHQSVAYFGSHLRDPQVDLLRRLDPVELILVPDPDAYDKVLQKAVDLVSLFRRVSIVSIPAGKDPDTIANGKAARRLISERRHLESKVDGLSISVGKLRNPFASQE